MSVSCLRLVADRQLKMIITGLGSFYTRTSCLTSKLLLLKACQITKYCLFLHFFSSPGVKARFSSVADPKYLMTPALYLALNYLCVNRLILDILRIIVREKGSTIHYRELK